MYMLSHAEENYLKAIYNIGLHTGKSVNTNLIAEKLSTKPSSVSDMIKRLSDKKLIDYKKYQGAILTSYGEKVAVNTVRSHRLWEVFLVDCLNYRWDEVHELAEQLEHIKSDSLVDKLDAFLKFPTHDPHGDPIPDKKGNVNHHKNVMLSSININESCIVVGVKDSSSAFLKLLDRNSIALGSTIKVISKEPFDNSIHVKMKGNKQSFTISQQVSNNLFVKKI